MIDHNRVTPFHSFTPWSRVIMTVAVLLAALTGARDAKADDPCSRPICRDGYHYNGERCQSEPAPGTQALSHYYPEEPLCPAGWRVQGPDCVRIVCCEKAACRDDERYRDGYCHRGPTFFGWRSHYRAACDDGWVLDERRGICHDPDCRDGQPPPPARAAGPDDGPPPNRRDDREQPPPPARAAGKNDGPPPAGRQGDKQPPPPAVPAGRGEPPPRSRPTDEPPPPPVVDPVEVTRLLPAPCVDLGGTVTIEGERFGREQGSRRAVLGGHGISVPLRVTNWANRHITAVIPDDDRIAFSQWYYIGIQDANGYWISNLSRTITICRELE